MITVAVKEKEGIDLIEFIENRIVELYIDLENFQRQEREGYNKQRFISETMERIAENEGYLVKLCYQPINSVH